MESDALSTLASEPGALGGWRFGYAETSFSGTPAWGSCPKGLPCGFVYKASVWCCSREI